ncbi:hypothetical protein ACLM5H_02955 [Fredinandcohnia humi]
MLVEINLLPSKPKRNVATFTIIGIISVLLLIGTTILLLRYFHLLNEKEREEAKLNQIRQSIAAIEETIGEYETSTSYVKLKDTIIWLEGYPIKTVPFLQHITSLLPERGFIENIEFAQNGRVFTRVRFDTNREVAYYIKLLSDSPLLTSVNLQGIETSAVGELEDSVPRSIASIELLIDKEALKAYQKELEE